MIKYKYKMSIQINEDYNFICMYMWHNMWNVFRQSLNLNYKEFESWLFKKVIIQKMKKPVKKKGT